MNLKIGFFLVIFFIQSQSMADVIDESELKARVSERWGAIINHKFGDSYKFETPTYKKVFSKDLYVSQFSHGIDWNLTKIADIKYDADSNVAVVLVLVETKPRNSKGLDATVNTVGVEIREKWLHIKGRWWHSSSE